MKSEKIENSEYIICTGLFDEYEEDLKDNEVIAYTSGLGGLFKPGIPIGKMSGISTKKINFFSDFTQLNYVKIISYKIGGKN